MGWARVWPRVVWVKELGAQGEQPRKETGEMLHSARGAHLEGHRIGYVEQVPCNRKIEQVVDDTIDGFEVCGPGTVIGSHTLPQRGRSKLLTHTQ